MGCVIVGLDCKFSNVNWNVAFLNVSVRNPTLQTGLTLQVNQQEPVNHRRGEKNRPPNQNTGIKIRKRTSTALHKHLKSVLYI